MTLTITGVPDCRAVLGPSQSLRAYQCTPGTSDYPSSGYVVQASQIDMQYIFGAAVIAQNAAAALYAVKPVLPSSSFGSNPAPGTSILLEVTQNDSQAAVNTNLGSCQWIIEFLGY